MYSQQKQELYKYLKSLGRISEEDYEYFLRDETGTFIPQEKTPEEVKKEWLQTYENAMSNSSIQWENSKQIPEPVLIYDIESLPEGIELSHIVEAFKNENIILWDSKGSDLAREPRVIFNLPGTKEAIKVLDVTTPEGKQELENILKK